MKNAMKASELVAILQEKIKEHGDLEISINTQEGASYSLYSADDVHLIVGTYLKDGSKVEMLEIG